MFVKDFIDSTYFSICCNDYNGELAVLSFVSELLIYFVAWGAIIALVSIELQSDRYNTRVD